MSEGAKGKEEALCVLEALGEGGKVARAGPRSR